MWDLSYAIPSLLLLILFIGYYFFLPRVPNKMNRTFIMLLLIEVTTIIFNLLSSWVDMHYMDFSKGVVEIINSLFFSLFFLRAYVFFLFTTTVVKADFCNDIYFSMLKRIPLQLSVILALTSPWTGLLYSVDEKGYHSGPYYKVLYLVFWLYIALSIIIVLGEGKHALQKRERISLYWCNTLLFIGTIFRLLVPRVLMMNTFCVLAVTILYLSFENPDFYLEKRSRIFNSRALRQYLEEINGVKPYKILAFAIHNYRDIRQIYGARQMDAGIDMIGSFLIESFTKMEVFYYRSGRFVILDGDDLELDLDTIKEKIQKRFDSPWNAPDAELFLDVSMVYIDLGNHIKSADTVFNILAESLEKVANAGSEDFIAIDGRDVISSEKETLIKRNLEKAIEQNLVEAFLQPIVDAKNHKIVGAEALARIRDDEGNIIPPGSFIPIAERNGRINQLGEQVLDRVCNFISQNDLSKLGVNWINVNLSPIQFMRQNLDEQLASIIAKTGINPKYIHLEVTEESLIDETLLLKQIENIQKSGFYFVLDDYGKGYSNLARLRKCPFINVKIDMSLVWEYSKHPDEMLPNMISTFKNLGFSITAEGIEDENMAWMMAEIGCDYLQGFYFSKALTMDEFVEKYS